MQKLIETIKNSPSSIFTKDDILALLEVQRNEAPNYQTFYKHQEIVDAMGLRHQAIPAKIAYGTHDELDALVKYEIMTAKFRFSHGKYDRLNNQATYLIWVVGDELYASFRNKEDYDEAIYNDFIEELKNKAEELLSKNNIPQIEGTVEFEHNIGSANISVSLDFDTDANNRHESDYVSVKINTIDLDSIYNDLIQAMEV